LNALSHGAERHAFLALISLGPEEPECQASCIVRGPPRSARRAHAQSSSSNNDVTACPPLSARRAHAQRALSTRLPPPPTLHDDANHYTNGLPKAHRVPVVYSSEESTNGQVSFKLPHDSGQRSPVMMDLRLLHPPLPVFIVEKLKQIFKRIARIVHHVGERSSLTIVKKLCLGHCDARHDDLLATWF
jgi:hypothetical protein